ncbi:patatin-like phospholipase family protein [Changchengzhania lutea]|uniref:patatin-like phospholipase family protein n=1 Tax=Changchengzhania lutea TaxID=2049305 RepID=UPI0029393940|nr:patatin-like phospholipase family protein [Changchengzhania lutea]
MEENNIFPTHIAGASAGATVGALYAHGYSWKAILRFFKDIQVLDIKKYALGKPGFIDTEKFYPQFNDYIKEDHFDALQKPLYITATDILNGQRKTFHSGQLIKPILASAAFPGVFAPVKIEGSCYVDGYNAITIKDLKHSHHGIEHAFKLRPVKGGRSKFSDCDLVISPKELNKYGTFDKKYLDGIFNIGYQATVKALNRDPLFKLKSTLRVS